MQTTDNLLSEMRMQLLKLYSPEIQFKFESPNLASSVKEDFVNYRENYRRQIFQLELQSLENIFAQMQALETELNQAIESLDKAFEDVNNTVEIVKSIKNLSSIMVRLLTIF